MDTQTTAKKSSMKKILFLIHDLGQGGAEKVLVNLVNNLDRNKFDISITVLFGGGVNEQFLKPDIHFRAVFPKEIPGNSKLMKLLTPKQLHKLCVREHYDIEVSYLEGPSARVISGCQDENTKLVSWIHCTMHSNKDIFRSFRSYKEAAACYSCFDRNVFVSGEVMNAFQEHCLVSGTEVLYNTNDSDKIIQMADEPMESGVCRDVEIKMIGIGKIVEVKGFDRLARVHKRLRDDGYPLHTYILGEGRQKEEIVAYLEQNHLTDSFTFLGYQTNPYKYVKNSDLFVCSSHSEGFSTAATEALIVGTPVCTVDVSGMKAMLGENNEYGIITENNEDALYEGIKCLLDDPALLRHYKEKAIERGKSFSTEATVKAVEEMLLSL